MADAGGVPAARSDCSRSRKPGPLPGECNPDGDCTAGDGACPDEACRRELHPSHRATRETGGHRSLAIDSAKDADERGDHKPAAAATSTASSTPKTLPTGRRVCSSRLTAASTIDWRIEGTDGGTAGGGRHYVDCPWSAVSPAGGWPGCLQLLWRIVEGRGIPLALHTDHHGVFWYTHQRCEERDEEPSADKWKPTQFERAMHELGGEQVFASSSQAKGRAERVAGTFQDRLATELRLGDVSTLEDGLSPADAVPPPVQAAVRRASS